MLLVETWFAVKLENKYSFYARTWVIGFVSIARIAAILAGLPLIVFAIIIAVEAVIRAVLLLYYGAIRKIQLFQWRFSWDIAFALLKDSKFLMFQSLVIMIYLRADHIMLKHFASIEEVGMYGAATRISTVLFPFAAILGTVAFPAIAKSFKTKSRHFYHRTLQTYADILMLISLPAVLLLVVCAPWGVSLLLGPAYQGAVVILQIHGVMILITAMEGVKSQWVITENFVKIGFLSAVLGTLLNLTLNMLLIPKYGGKGAAIASVGSQLFSTLVIFMLLPRYFMLAKILLKSLTAPLRVRQVYRNIKESLAVVG